MGPSKKARESQIDITRDIFLRSNLIINHDFMSLPFKAQTVTLQHKNNLWLLQDNELLPGTRGHPERHSFERLYELRSENVTRDAENWQAQSPTPRHEARVHEPRTERCREALTVYLIRRGKSRPTDGCSSPSRDGLFFAFFQHSHPWQLGKCWAEESHDLI